MIGSGGGVVLIRVSPDGNLFARWLAGVVGFGQRPLEGTARRRRLPVGVGVVAPPTHAGGEKGSAAEPCTPYLYRSLGAAAVDENGRLDRSFDPQTFFLP